MEAIRNDVNHHVNPLTLHKLEVPEGKTLPVPEGFVVNAPQTMQFEVLPLKPPRANAQNISHVVFLHENVQLSGEEIDKIAECVNEERLADMPAPLKLVCPHGKAVDLQFALTKKEDNTPILVRHLYVHDKIDHIEIEISAGSPCCVQWEICEIVETVQWKMGAREFAEGWNGGDNSPAIAHLVGSI